jgi:hypothetical protein
VPGICKYVSVRIRNRPLHAGADLPLRRAAC